MGCTPGCPSLSTAAGIYQPGFCRGMAEEIMTRCLLHGKGEGCLDVREEERWMGKIDEKKCQSLAKKALQQKKLTYEKAYYIAEQIPFSDDRDGDGTRTMCSGLFNGRGSTRITPATEELSWVTRFFNAFFRHHIMVEDPGQPSLCPATKQGSSL